MKIAEWPSGSGPTIGPYGWELYKWDETTAAAVVDANCSDGCGNVCYNLGSYSVRMAWHSYQDPICQGIDGESDEQVQQACIAGMLPRPSTTVTTTATEAAVASAFRQHSVSFVSRLVVGLCLLFGASKI